jgi:hypothetical protein
MNRLQYPRFAVYGITLASLLASAQGATVLSPSDLIFAVDHDSVSPAVSSSPPSGNENAVFILDGNAGTKYLNFGEEWSGFIVTPGASIAQSFTITTAGDEVPRDPASYYIYGTNSSIFSTNHSNGTAEPWTFIGKGALSLTDNRNTLGGAIDIANSTSYSSYRVLFPTVKNAASANSMQIADFQFYSGTGGTGSALLNSSNPIIAIDRQPQSNSPAGGGEDAIRIIDGNLGSKYLNFGRENSGFVVAPAIGLSIVDSFQLTTANDALERDPTAYTLYGSNDPVLLSQNNTFGDENNWSIISSGALSLPDDRNTTAPLVTFPNATPYLYYKLIFNENKSDLGQGNSIQVAEVQFHGTAVPEPATAGLLALGVIGTLGRRRRG